MNIEFKLRLAIFTLLTIWVSAYSQDNSLNKDNILFIEQRVTFPYTGHSDSETYIVLTKDIKK